MVFKRFVSGHTEQSTRSGAAHFTEHRLPNGGANTAGGVLSLLIELHSPSQMLVTVFFAVCKSIPQLKINGNPV